MKDAVVESTDHDLIECVKVEELLNRKFAPANVSIAQQLLDEYWLPSDQTAQNKPSSLNRHFVIYQAPDGKPNQFATDLENLFLFDSKKQFKGIPIYAVVDKLGKVITNDAKRPSSGEELKEQLQKTNNSHD